MEPTENAAAVFQAIQVATEEETECDFLPSALYGAKITNEAYTGNMWGKHSFTVVLPTGEVIEVELRQVK